MPVGSSRAMHIPPAPQGLEMSHLTRGSQGPFQEKKKKIKAHFKTRKEKRTLVLHIMDEYEPRIHEAVSNVLKIKPKDGTRIYRSMKKNICVDFFLSLTEKTLPKCKETCSILPHKHLKVLHIKKKKKQKTKLKGK